MRDVALALVPALFVALVAIALATRVARLRPAAGALAVGAGALAGHLAWLGWPAWPLVLDGWLVLVAALALVAGTAERAALRERRAGAHALRVVVAALVGVALLRARAPYWAPGKLWGTAALVALGVAVNGALLDPALARARPAWGLATGWALAAGTAGAVLAGGSYKLALLAGAAAVATAVVLAARLFDRAGRTDDAARGVAAVLAPVLGAAAARNTVYGEQPPLSAALLALAPGGACLALLARGRLGRAAEPVALALVVALGVAAAAVAAPLDDDRGSYPY